MAEASASTGCIWICTCGLKTDEIAKLTRAMPATQKECSHAEAQGAQRKQRVLPASPGKRLFPHVLCEPLRTLREAKKGMVHSNKRLALPHVGMNTMTLDHNKKFRPLPLFNALPDIILAGTFMYAWLYPEIFEPSRVRGLIVCILMEFFVVHSSFFMGITLHAQGCRSAKLKMALIFGVGYSAFIVALAVAFREWWPIAAFWLLIANRLLILLPGQALEGDKKELIKRSWISGCTFWVAAAFLSVLPWPALGITLEIVHAMQLPGEGIWIDTPQRAIAAGVMYFGITALSEINGHRWLLLFDDSQSPSASDNDSDLQQDTKRDGAE